MNGKNFAFTMQRMIPYDFGDPLTFSLLPSSIDAAMFCLMEMLQLLLRELQ